MAFKSCTSLTSVTIPGTVTSIGYLAFDFCTSLTSVTIPSKVTTIGNGAFYMCQSLKSITIPSSVRTIGEQAFFNCQSLKSVFIPRSVTTIGGGPFSSCTALPSIDVSSWNPNYVSVDGVLYNKGMSTLIQFPAGKTDATFVIPSTVTTIGDHAFDTCTALTSVTIPNGVKTIGAYTFSDCTALTSVTIPSSVTTIGDRAFLSCKALTSVIMSGSVIGHIGEFAFTACPALTSMIFLGLVAPTGVAASWVAMTSTAVIGHAYAASNFPAPGNFFNGLMMGSYIDASATHFLVTAPSSVAAGTSFSVTVTALDRYNNVDTAYTGTVHFTSTDPAANLPYDYQFVGGDSGVHTFGSNELFTLGYQTITATSVTHYPIMPITGKSNAILVKGNYMMAVNSAYGNPTPWTWVVQGSSFTASVSSPDGPTFYQHSERHVCIGYSIDGGPLTAGTSYTFTNVQGPHDITFEWKEQFEMLFVVNGLGSDSAGTVLTVGTSSYSYGQVGSASGWYDTMPTFHWTQDVPGSTGVRYDLKTAITSYPPAQILINTATYQTQYQLTMSTTYGMTSPSVGNHWYDAGTMVSIKAAAPAHSLPNHFFLGWSGGMGSGAYTGTSNPATVTMTRPISERAIWS